MNGVWDIEVGDSDEVGRDVGFGVPSVAATRWMDDTWGGIRNEMDSLRSLGEPGGCQLLTAPKLFESMNLILSGIVDPLSCVT